MVFTINDHNYISVNQLLTCDRCSDIDIIANLFYFMFRFCFVYNVTVALLPKCMTIIAIKSNDSLFYPVQTVMVDVAQNSHHRLGVRSGIVALLENLRATRRLTDHSCGLRRGDGGARGGLRESGRSRIHMDNRWIIATSAGKGSYMLGYQLTFRSSGFYLSNATTTAGTLIECQHLIIYYF